MFELRISGTVSQRKGHEGKIFEYFRGGGTWQFVEGDGEEGGYGEGSGDLSSADWDRGAGVCEYSGGEGVGSIYPERKD